MFSKLSVRFCPCCGREFSSWHWAGSEFACRGCGATLRIEFCNQTVRTLDWVLRVFGAVVYLLVWQRYDLYFASIFMFIAVSDVIPLFVLESRITMRSLPLREPYRALAIQTR